MIKTILLLLWSQTLLAGVGGIDGGTVLFQKNSTWVNMVYSKTLCFKEDRYFAKSKRCIEWDNSSDRRTCVQFEPIIMEQPKFSTRQRCNKVDEDGCKEWITVPFVQKRDRLVKFKDEDNNVIRTEKLRIKSCE